VDIASYARREQKYSFPLLTAFAQARHRCRLRAQSWPAQLAPRCPLPEVEQTLMRQGCTSANETRFRLRPQEEPTVTSTDGW